MMELAVSLTPPEALRAKPGLFKKYGRVYIGSSFCQNLLPDAADVRRLRAAGARAITLATPPLTGAALKQFLGTLGRVLETEKEVEVSVNDLGLLEALRRRFRGRVTPLLGRPVSHDFLRMSPEFLKRFFREYGIKLLESDEGGMVKNLPASTPLKIAFHYPLEYLAMSRLCAHTGEMSAACRRPCAGAPAAGLTRPGGESLILYSNAYFRRNAPCGNKAVKRLVFTPCKP
ncbi:MAG: hypothetical protein Q7R35_19100 [Elusimicrobiota bacterium]|nr:hypothetical protein [Elusimicrobiota bacterium]